MFYKIINKISDTEIVDGACDFRVMTRQMVDAILEMSEYNRFSKGIFSWVGFNTKYLEYKIMNALPEKQAGTFGAYSNIQSTESSTFRVSRLILHRLSASFRP